MSDVFDVVRDTVVAREPPGVVALTAALAGVGWGP